jgi:hypothetical protein
MSNHAEIERKLQIAKQSFQKALKALSAEHNSIQVEDYRIAQSNLLKLERELAAARNEEYAEPFGFPVTWDAGAPLPQLVCNDYRVCLGFYCAQVNPEWHGQSIKLVNPADEQTELLALVEFEHCVAAKLGSPNDEVFHGHPLNGKGRETYAAQRVVNSKWLKEIERINSVHYCYDPTQWLDDQHFIFWFHDSTFECIAKSYKLELLQTSMRNLLSIMVERVLTRLQT